MRKRRRDSPRSPHGLRAYAAILLAGLLGVNLVNELLLLVQPVLACSSLLDEGCLPLPHVHLETEIQWGRCLTKDPPGS